jgi:hypothetical protein
MRGHGRGPARRRRYHDAQICAGVQGVWTLIGGGAGRPSHRRSVADVATVGASTHAGYHMNQGSGSLHHHISEITIRVYIDLYVMMRHAPRLYPVCMGAVASAYHVWSPLSPHFTALMHLMHSISSLVRMSNGRVCACKRQNAARVVCQVCVRCVWGGGTNGATVHESSLITWTAHYTHAMLVHQQLCVCVINVVIPGSSSRLRTSQDAYPPLRRRPRCNT